MPKTIEVDTIVGRPAAANQTFRGATKKCSLYNRKVDNKVCGIDIGGLKHMEDLTYLCKYHIEDSHLMKLTGIAVKFAPWERDPQNPCMCYLKLTFLTRDNVVRSVSAGSKDIGQDLYRLDCKRNQEITDFTLFTEGQQFKGLRIDKLSGPKENVGAIDSD